MSLYFLVKLDFKRLTRKYCKVLNVPLLTSAQRMQMRPNGVPIARLATRLLLVSQLHLIVGITFAKNATKRLKRKFKLQILSQFLANNLVKELKEKYAAAIDIYEGTVR